MGFVEDNLASEAGLCYNEDLELLSPENALTLPGRVSDLIRRPKTMDTISSCPQDNNPPMRVCTGPCGRTLLATPEYFHRGGRGKDGLQAECKSCKKERTKEYNNRPEVIEKRKQYYQENHDDLLEKRRQYYQENGEHVRAREKSFRDNNPEIIKARKKAYYDRPENKERKREHDRIYRNRPEVKARHRVWLKSYRALPYVKEKRRLEGKLYYSRPEVRERYRIQGPEYWKIYWSRPETKERKRVHHANRQARKNAIQGTYTPAQIQDQLKRQKHKCYYCKKRLKKTKGKYIYHIEHTFPLSRVAGTDIPANDMGYIVLACPTCNHSKGDKFPWEWPEGGRLL